MALSFRYILRYQIDPTFHPEDRTAELVDFCRDNRVDEVMLFVTPEELSTGHPTDNEIDAYVELGRQVKAVLDDAEIDLSLNPWTTTYHVSRGRTFRQGQAFMPMVGENGYVSPISACPLCERWQAWLCDTFARLVRDIQPTVLWVEDDWRLHNHEPGMSWGGCFCDTHLKRFSTVVGRPVGREELVEKVLGCGAPHPWRGVWLDLWRDTMLEPARRLRDAVQTVSASTRLGLMSSVPDVHSIEGRDWHAMQDAIGADPAFLTRPHLPPYTATRALHTTPAVTRQTIANLKRPIEVYPELENSPRCGQYSKSHAYNAWQCLHAACYGSHGITINHFDMMGNGIALDPTFGKTLREIKDRLNTIASLGIDDTHAQGVRVLFSPDVARAIHGDGRDTFDSLNNHSEVWSNVCYVLGISHALRPDIPHEPGPSPYAVGGQTLRAFSDTEVSRLLGGAVILDACSVEVLHERGFGSDIGVGACQWEMLETSGYAYEHILEPDPARFGLAFPRMTAQRCAQRLPAIDADPSASVRSQIRHADHKDLFPGTLVYRNARGGRIAMTAYPFDGGHQFFMGFFNVFRRRLMQELLFEIAPLAPLAAVTSHPMHLYRVPTTAGTCLALCNPLHDAAERPVVALSPGRGVGNHFKMLDAAGAWQTFSVEVRAEGNIHYLTLPTTVQPLESCVVLIPDV